MILSDDELTLMIGYSLRIFQIIILFWFLEIQIIIQDLELRHLMTFNPFPIVLIIQSIQLKLHIQQIM